MHILHKDNNNGCPLSPSLPCVNGNAAYTTKLTFCIYLFLLYVVFILFLFSFFLFLLFFLCCLQPAQ